MEVKIIHSHTKAHMAKGLTVVIDVLRAFSTACFVMANKAKVIIPVADIDFAYKLKKENPHYILMGERHGLRQPGFDYGNSPAEVESVDFTQKTVIFTTTTGTQGIVNATCAEEVITGSFVNAQAVLRYIKRSNYKEVCLICTDARYEKGEDEMFAQYIKAHLEGSPLDFEPIKEHLAHHPISQGYLVTPLTKFSEVDFDFAFHLDRFDFVLKAEKDGGLINLKKI